MAIVGVGYSTIGRRTGLSVQDLVMQSSIAALDDAGLTFEDVDGISTMGSDAVSDGWLMGIEPLNWFSSAIGPAFVYPALMSIAAIAAGLCHTALTLRIVQQQSSGAEMAAGRARFGNEQVPIGVSSPNGFGSGRI